MRSLKKSMMFIDLKIPSHFHAFKVSLSMCWKKCGGISWDSMSRFDMSSMTEVMKSLDH